MKKILITQRLDFIGEHREQRDNIDYMLPNFVETVGFCPILVPNNLINFNKFVKILKPEGIILSGGGDSFKDDKRAKNEKKLIRYCIKNSIPLLGICRGAQAINLYFGGQLKKINKHVGKNHRIFGKMVKSKHNIKVNSYHNYGFAENQLANNLEILAESADKIVKCFSHKKHKLFGIMWHPERYKKYKKFDINFVKRIFN
jgi:putative glutamine amidotransferase